MSSLNAVASRTGRAGAPARAAAIEKRLRRYAKAHQPRLRAMCERHPALADLALTFPALLFALATERDEQGVAAIVAGSSLKEAAQKARLPLWTRALPPEAFAAPLPALPDGPMFARRIANHPPRTVKHAAKWLEAVAWANIWGDENVAIWIARELSRALEPKKPPRRRRKKKQPSELQRLKLICLWAWFSARPETEAAALAERRWSPDMKFVVAEDEARTWLLGVEALCALGDKPLADGWLEPATIDGLEFTPLLTADDLIAEARAMHNCLRTYARAMRGEHARIWSVRRDGLRVATLEITGAWGCERFLTLGEGHTKWNRSVAPEVQRAIFEWLRGQPLRAAPKPLDEKEASPDPKIWRRLMRPYWLGKRALFDWLPLSPSDQTFWNLHWAG
jgi:hypothetical protein